MEAREKVSNGNRDLTACGHPEESRKKVRAGTRAEEGFAFFGLAPENHSTVSDPPDFRA